MTLISKIAPKKVYITLNGELLGQSTHIIDKH
jgi:hypothetical protein